MKVPCAHLFSRDNFLIGMLFKYSWYTSCYSGSVPPFIGLCSIISFSVASGPSKALISNETFITQMGQEDRRGHAALQWQFELCTVHSNNPFISSSACNTSDPPVGGLSVSHTCCFWETLDPAVLPRFLALSCSDGPQHPGRPQRADMVFLRKGLALFRLDTGQDGDRTFT